MNLIKRLIKGEEGQGLVEYALIVGLIALVCVVALGATGTSLSTLWDNISGEMDKASNAVVTPAP